MPLMISGVNLTIRPDRTGSITYWLTLSIVRESGWVNQVNRPFFKILT